MPPPMACNAEDDTITDTMRYHLGDDLPFVWRGVKTKKKAKTSVRKK